MPGLFGFSAPNTEIHTQKAQLERMRDLLDHSGELEVDRLYLSRSISASRIVPVVNGTQHQPLTLNGTYYLWYDGEFYNRHQLRLYNSTNGDLVTDAEWFLSNLVSCPDKSEFLRQIDGHFSSVLYDSVSRKIFLMSDRFGLSYLFWAVRDNALVWSSEQKGFLACPFDLRLDHDAIQQFVAIGYLIGSRTWFHGIKLLPPATIVVWDMENRSTHETRYWRWNDEDVSVDDNSFRDVATELGRRFIAAVEKRCSGHKKLGIHLSGGRDSRAILAAVPEPHCSQLNAITFGSVGCDDVKIAQEIAARKKVKHTVFELNRANLLERRIEGVWYADGSVSIKHMHAWPFQHSLKELFEINLSGAGGDGIFGGGHLFHSADFDSYARKLGLDSRTYPDVYLSFKDFFHELGDSHALYIEHRIRRFSLNSAQLAKTMGIEWRFPFLDKEVQELLCAIPIEKRKDGRLYNQMLLSTFPDFFESIPWENTGLPIGAGNWRHRLERIARKKTTQKVLGVLKLGSWFPPKKPYAAYAEWMRVTSNWQYFESLLGSPDALVREFVTSESLNRALTAHSQGADRSEALCRYLTLEIWLRCLEAQGPQTAEDVRNERSREP